MNIPLIFLRHGSITGVLHVLEGIFKNREHLAGTFRILVAAFHKLLHTLYLPCDEVEVAHLQLKVNEFHIANRVDAAFAMRDIRVIEAAKHMYQSVNGLNLREKFVTDALPTLAQTGKVNNLNRGRNNTFRMRDIID